MANKKRTKRNTVTKGPSEKELREQEEMKKLRFRARVISFIPAAVMIVAALVMRYTTNVVVFKLSLGLIIIGIWVVAAYTVYSYAKAEEVSRGNKIAMIVFWVALAGIATYAAVSYFIA